MKWKRISGSDITKCYQQAAGLALMVSDEIEQHLVSQCIAELENNLPMLEQINKVQGNPKEVTVILAKHYLEWIESKRTISLLELEFVSIIRRLDALEITGE